MRNKRSQAVQSGLSAAQVAASARDSNRFTVSLNAEPESKISFWLNYEELLQRRDGRYELVVNLHPGQPVKDLTVQVMAPGRAMTSMIDREAVAKWHTRSWQRLLYAADQFVFQIYKKKFNCSKRLGGGRGCFSRDN